MTSTVYALTYEKSQEYRWLQNAYDDDDDDDDDDLWLATTLHSGKLP